MAGVLEAAVELGLEQLPDGVSVGPDDHGALDRRAVGQLGLQDELVVPGGEVLGLGGDAQALAVIGHVRRGYREGSAAPRVHLADGDRAGEVDVVDLVVQFVQERLELAGAEHLALDGEG